MDWSHENMYRLRYFKIRGLAEAVRLVLEEAGAPYVEASFTGDEWKAAKPALTERGTLAFGQLPLLQTPEGDNFVQSKAIIRHLARKYKLNLEDLGESVLTGVDMAAEGVEDIRSKYGRMVNSPTYSQADLDEYRKEWYPTRLKAFEKAMRGDYLLGDRISYADLTLWDIVDSHTEWLGAEPLAAAPKLQAWFSRVAARPNIAAYLASERRPSYNSYPIKNPKQ